MTTQHPQLIGLTGLAGSGKDTVRAILEEHGYYGMAFADPIRYMLRQLLLCSGISTEYMDERTLKEEPIPQIGVSYRHLAQSLGTEWGRAVVPDLWLRLASSHIADVCGAGELLTQYPPRFVVSDVRFVNEAAWILERGGVIWRIDRPGIEAVRAHVSEQEMELIGIDQTILNGGTLDDLRTQVAQALSGGAA